MKHVALFAVVGEAGSGMVDNVFHFFFVFYNLFSHVQMIVRLIHYEIR